MKWVLILWARAGVRPSLVLVFVGWRGAKCEHDDLGQEGGERGVERAEAGGQEHLARRVIAISVCVDELNAEADRDHEPQREADPFPGVWLDFLDAGQLAAQRVEFIRLLDRWYDRTPQTKVRLYRWFGALRAAVYPNQRFRLVAVRSRC